MGKGKLWAALAPCNNAENTCVVLLETQEGSPHDPAAPTRFVPDNFDTGDPDDQNRPAHYTCELDPQSLAEVLDSHLRSLVQVEVATLQDKTKALGPEALEGLAKQYGKNRVWRSLASDDLLIVHDILTLLENEAT